MHKKNTNKDCDKRDNNNNNNNNNDNNNNINNNKYRDIFRSRGLSIRAHLFLYH